MTNLVIVALAVAYTVYAWKHSELFASWYSWCEDQGLTGLLQQISLEYPRFFDPFRKVPGDGWGVSDDPAIRRATRLGLKLTYLAGCPFCLSFWASLTFSAAVGTLSLGLFVFIVRVLAAAMLGYIFYSALAPNGRGG